MKRIKIVTSVRDSKVDSLPLPAVGRLNRLANNTPSLARPYSVKCTTKRKVKRDCSASCFPRPLTRA